MAAASTNPVSDEDLSDLFKKTPVRCLNVTARRCLSQYLNPPKSLPARCGIVPDWRGVAEMRDLTYIQIQNIALSDDPTGKLLDEYSSQIPEDSVETLIDILTDLERFDALEEARPHIVRDVQRWSRRQNAVQVPLVTSNQPDPIPRHNDFLAPEDRYIVIDDSEDNVTIFDAFVCYTKDPKAKNDRAFIMELIRVLEGQFGLKLYIMERDLLPGCDELNVSAALIEKRCKRTILVISKAYLASQECEVQTRSALCFSPTCHNKKILPIFIERKVYVPTLLRAMNAVDMTVEDGQIREWAWKRIASALKMPLILTNEDKRAERSIETLSFKLDKRPSLDSLGKTDEQFQQSSV